MSKVYIKKSLLIQKEAKFIFNYLNDFHNWPQWSPWLIADPNTSLNIDTDGKYYNWEGDVTGSGDMRVLSETKNKSLSCSLNFYKPWKSKAENTKAILFGMKFRVLNSRAIPIIFRSMLF